MSYRWLKQKPLSTAVQAMSLRKYFPDTEVRTKIDVLTWEGVASARESSMEYQLRLAYKLGERPDFWVIEPNLQEIAGERKIPHLFSQTEQSLCLHYSGIWKPHQLLTKTIVPWAVLWTEYFEWWLATDRWAGEEVHHSGDK